MVLNKKMLHSDVYLGAVCLVIFLWLHNIAAQWDEGPRAFPVIVLQILEIISALILVFGIRQTFKSQQGMNLKASIGVIKFPLLYFCLIILYGVGISRIGFFVSTIIFLITSMIVMHLRGKKQVFLITIGVIVFLYVTFVLMLKVRMPSALLF